MLFINIKQLLQVREGDEKFVAGDEMSKLPLIENAFLRIEDGKIKDFGKMENCPSTEGVERLDCRGRIVMPSWCDSHTHLVYAGNRVREFVDRIHGLTYQEIAAKGGGILNSAKKLQETSREELYAQASERLKRVAQMGTGAIEIKSGYGLNTGAEIKMLEVIKDLSNTFPLGIKSTLLAAHAIPEKYKSNPERYVDEVCQELIPEVARQKLAEYIDVFCETGYFTVKQMDRILKVGAEHGLVPKVHVNQFNSIGGVQKAIAHRAKSVDHLEVLTENDLEALKHSETLAVALPGCSFFINIPYTPGRQIIDAGLPLALASDFNPGSSPSGNMTFMARLACLKMNLTPEEAINAATLNGAYAMDFESDYGSISKGKNANLIVTKELHDYAELMYAYADDQIERVYIKGQAISDQKEPFSAS